MNNHDVAFLEQAARLLHDASPQISRHLSLKAVEARQSQDSSAIPNDVCLACGTIMRAGETAKIRSARILCLICYRTRKLPKERKASRKAMLAAQRSGLVIEKTSQKAPQKNTKSKDRQKARAKGLASLLKPVETSTPSKGLNLSDFML